MIPTVACADQNGAGDHIGMEAMPLHLLRELQGPEEPCTMMTWAEAPDAAFPEELQGPYRHPAPAHWVPFRMRQSERWN